PAAALSGPGRPANPFAGLQFPAGAAVFCGMRLPRFLLPALLAAAAASPAKELTGVYEPAAGPCPTVEEALAKMTVPDGYEVRNFAAEPMVINPVAMSWDRRGRLWVVELYEYPTGAKVPNEYSKIAEDENFRPVA